MESLLDLAPIVIIGGSLVCLGIYYLYSWYRGGTVRCIKCGKYTWEGMRGLNDAGDMGDIHSGSCSVSTDTGESRASK